MKLIYKIKWDKKGFYLTQKNDSVNYTWFLIGPVISHDGLKIFQIVIGPLHISFGIHEA